MIRFLICANCGLVLAVGAPVKKTICPRCQAPVTARASAPVETKSTERRVAA